MLSALIPAATDTISCCSRVGLMSLQRSCNIYLLDIAAQLIKPGGRVVYVTCSLLDEEGAGQFEAFLARHPQLQPQAMALPLGQARGQGIRLAPAHDGTDGFFIACAG